MPMHVELVSVERKLWSGDANAVFARTPDGEIGILPGHQPLLAELSAGWFVRIDREGESELRVAVDGGFLSVREDGVSVLAEVAQNAEDVDVAEARELLERSQNDDTPESVDARNRALSRLRAAGESV